ncbi:MAG: hypothetical protein AMS18_03625 [Gemmatimonas sp. SG8_17]|nr:MAG: hypothetical protein AMS18_03625 [Gemmatimonas sp. SG8_17]
MKKEVLAAGLLGGTVMLVWLFVTNAVLPFKSNLIHRDLSLANQLEVHQALKDNIAESGTYSVPYLSQEEEVQFPDYRNQPVYSITYEGFTHGGGSGGSTVASFPVVLLAVFVPPLIAAWMLSVASPTILAKYSRRFLFVAALGVIVALYDDVLQMAFGPQPKDYLTFLAINNLIAWALTGLVIARRIRPVRTPDSGTAS